MSNLIFDFDGTIADTLDHVVAVFQMVSRRDQPLSPEEIDQLRRLSSRQAVKAAGIPLWRVPRMIKKGMAHFSDRIPHMRSFDGLPETLAALHERGDRLFVLTSNNEYNVREFLRLHDLAQYFEALSCGASLFGKTRPLKRLVKRYNLDTADTWYVGDETRDITAAHKAGLNAAAVTWGFNHAEALAQSCPQVMLDSPVELLQLPKSSTY